MTISRAQMRRQLYAGGGIAGLVPRQQYGLGSIVKSIKGAVSGVVDAATDFAKSDVGQIALAIAAPYALGPAFGAIGLGGNVAGSAFLGNALRAGITNLALQGVTTGKFNLGQAAKAGVIGGGIQTGLNKFTAAGKYDPYKTDVTSGSDVLYYGDEPFPTIESVQTGPSYSPDTGLPIRTDQFANQNLTENVVGFPDDYMNEYASIISNESPSVDFGMTSAKADPLTSFQKDYMDVYEGIGAELEGGAVPVKTGVDSLGLDIEEIAARAGTDVSGSYNIPKPEPIKGIADILKDESLTIPQKISEGAKNLIGIGGGDETLKTLINQPSLSNLMTFAKSNPELLITSASLVSALSVPKQPDESDFDYEERMALVNDYASKYGKLAGVDMSNLGNISDFESYYKQRAKVAVGGLPEIPMGQPRQNQGGITELDYRDQGGFVPVGIKEKADDVPAMLSKNEFVFTADAVRNFGGGDVDKGAQKLYNVMKTLENGGTV
jgi:hypothetical protein